MISSFHLAYTWPYKMRIQNQLSIFNEITMLIVAYFVMVLVGISENTTKKQSAGLIIQRCLYVIWAVNFLIIMITFFRNYRIKLRKYCWKRKMKNMKA